jgi:cytochrome P450 family 6
MSQHDSKSFRSRFVYILIEFSTTAQFALNLGAKMFFQLLVYVLIPSLVAFYVWGKKRLNSLQEKGISCLEPSFPLGNMNGVGSKVHIVDRLQEIYEAFKKRDKLAGFYSMLKPTVVLIDLDLIKHVVIKDFNNFADRGVYSNEDADPVSAHM